MYKGTKCKERVRLLRVLLSALRSYDRQLGELSSVDGRTREEFVLVINNLREARTLAEVSEEAYKDHVKEHGCGVILS